jgi:hypothetical protein
MQREVTAALKNRDCDDHLSRRKAQSDRDSLQEFSATVDHLGHRTHVYLTDERRSKGEEGETSSTLGEYVDTLRGPL